MDGKNANSTDLQKKRSVVNQMPENYCQPGSPIQITERNLRKIRSLVMNVKENHSRMETVIRKIINLNGRRQKSDRIKRQNRAVRTNDDTFCIEERSEINSKAHSVKWKSCAIRILCRIFDTGRKNQIDYKAHGVKWKNCAFTYFLNIQGHE